MRRGSGEPAPYRYIGAESHPDAGGREFLGDHEHFDADGFLYLADRAVDMIVVGGSNVYPAEPGAALDEHPAVLSSCVIGLPDEDLGNIPMRSLNWPRTCLMSKRMIVAADALLQTPTAFTTDST